ncbi:MAG: ribonuclease P protein component [Candidatus Vogelbacteria bacterium]|nr:ribonuclease P protein component [Candidatus Vogelbacteria bacterium]
MLTSRISKALFPKILKEGRNFNAPNLSLRILRRSDDGPSAFSFVVAAKTAPKATRRNFLKRRGRHVIKKNLEGIKGGHYGVFFFKSGAVSLPFPAFEQEILNSLKQARMVQ